MGGDNRYRDRTRLRSRVDPSWFLDGLLPLEAPDAERRIPFIVRPTVWSRGEIHPVEQG